MPILVPTLYLRCKTCDTEFASMVGADRESFEYMILSSNEHTCPKGHTHAYDTEDYYLKE